MKFNKATVSLRYRGKEKHAFVRVLYYDSENNRKELPIKLNLRGDDKLNLTRAKAKKVQIEQSILEGSFDPSEWDERYKQIPSLKFGSYATNWYLTNIPLWQKSTQEGNKTRLYHRLLPIYGDHFMSEVLPSMITKHISDMILEKLQPKSIQHIISLLYQIFDDALEDGLIEKNPVTKKVKKRIPQIKKPKPEPFSIEEQFKILEYLEHSKPHLKAMIAVGFYTGMRLEEIIGLKWGDIDFSNQSINVCRVITHGKINYQTKTKKERKVDIIPSLMSHLIFHKKFTFINCNDWVFLNSKKNHYKYPSQDISKFFYPVLKILGIKRRSPGQMRHTFACTMVQAGEDFGWIRDMLGHETMKQIIERYANWRVDCNKYKGGLLLEEKLKKISSS